MSKFVHFELAVLKNSLIFTVLHIILLEIKGDKLKIFLFEQSALKRQRIVNQLNILDCLQ